MILQQALALLTDNNIQYILTTEPDKAAFYRQKGFVPRTHSGEFRLITIPNPNHAIGAQLIFDGISEDARFIDLEFGGYWYELFDTEEQYLAEELISEIHQIMSGTAYVIFARDTKTGQWQWDGMYDDYPDEEENSMEGFRRAMEKIKRPKCWWQKMTGKSTTYEIYNWHCHEMIVK